VKHVTRQHALRALECPETKTSDIPNARVYGSQVVTIAAFDVNVLSSPGGGGSARNCWILQILPFRSSPGVVTASLCGGPEAAHPGCSVERVRVRGEGLSCTVRDGTEKVGV